jgi:hypothetical protein
VIGCDRDSDLNIGLLLPCSSVKYNVQFKSLCLNKRDVPGNTRSSKLKGKYGNKLGDVWKAPQMMVVFWGCTHFCAVCLFRQSFRRKLMSPSSR